MIKNPTDDALLLKIKLFVKEEKRITQEILEYLAEVETRRLYALRGYSSLFSFCVEELGYAESSAQRRIASMRLIKSLPEIKEKLSEGLVNLSTLSQLASYIRQEEKTSDSKLPLEAKRDLLTVIENKSQSQCEKEFAKINPDLAKTKESAKPITETLTQIKFVASEELMNKLNRLRDLLGNKNKNSYAELIEELADLALKKLGAKTSTETKLAQPETTKVDNSSINAAAELKPTSEIKLSQRYIPAQLKRQVWNRDQGLCQYIDPLTRRRCESNTLSKSITNNR